jgi:hypothetical protein
MRASLFLSALFVTSLVGGTAAAERPEKDDRRPRVTRERVRETNFRENSRDRFVDRADRAATKIEKAEPAHRYQSKESRISHGARLSKSEMAAKLPKQAMERVRCSGGSDDCSSGKSSKKTSQSNADRGTKTAVAPTTTGQRGKAQAPSAAERALIQKMLSAKCSNKARGGCASDGSDNF